MAAQIKHGDLNDSLFRHLSMTGDADAAALSRAQTVAHRDGARLDRVLLRLGLIEEAALVIALCHTTGVEFAFDLSGLTLNEAIARDLTPSYLSAKIIAPLVAEGETIKILMADPADQTLIDELEFHLSRAIQPIGATTGQIRRFLAGATGPRPDAETHAAVEAQATRDQTALRNIDADGPVIRFVQEKLADAVLQGASDIHFESTESGVDIRYRINGVLVAQRSDLAITSASIMARLKVMAGVNVAERRLPQDGRFTAAIAGRNIDFRFSSLPTHWGESIVARVLDPKALRLGWDQLGFDQHTTATIKRVIEQPSGLFLVTGPTGSGKTTTLYTALAHLNTPARKIVTVEDPVEYNLPGIQQVQVHEAIGLNFARVLRGVLRHDPNVILVGEIRDAETAEIACRAAQVGRMVLSTLHTNSAAGAVTRLVDLGVPAFIVSEVLRGVLAQDLVGVPCGPCAGAGCSDCGGTGMAGRRLQAEVWLP